MKLKEILNKLKLRKDTIKIGSLVVLGLASIVSLFVVLGYDSKDDAVLDTNYFHSDKVVSDSLIDKDNTNNIEESSGNDKKDEINNDDVKVDSPSGVDKPNEDKTDVGISKEQVTQNNKKPENTDTKKEQVTQNNKKPENTNTNKEPSHTHSWVEQFKTVKHDEVGHWEKVCVKEAWVEEQPIFEERERAICNQCGADITDIVVAGGGDFDAHVKVSPGCSGWHSEWIQVQTGVNKIKHDAVYKDKWVVDKKAWTEKVSTGYKCSCGKWK